MTLSLNAVLAARNVELALTVGSSETVAVMGPNGAGKSSVIQMLAGLLKPDSGSATLDGRLLFQFNPGSVWLPPHERGVGVLAQEPLLFPHLNVLDNVAFGPRSQGAGKRESHEVARRWLGEVDAVELSRRLPSELSGGQAQRVALARALATDPELLLLDEPMAALDVNSTPFLRSLLKRVLAGRRAIIVTHDVLDALMLADRIIVMDGGRIVESGPTAAVLAHPRSAFAASLAGLNVISGVLSGSTLSMSDGGLVTGQPVGGLGAGSLGDDASGGPEGMAAFPPSAVSVFLAPPAGSPRNCFNVTVTELEPQGGHIRIRAGALAADVSAAAVAELKVEPGTEVFFVVKAAEVALYPA
ncbi:Molybdenum ABC transporter, ATP-binding protein ModC [Arthrobacter sp. PAMC 25486]|uniref:sulfate/molybdate ABC transporter ATP-binding protein n=1 Tax=Arthrobacter sp. PAMC 25486 TaxID=1494608 RepID=UPI000535EE41|nr:ABC transporter ATP-binding protein [Arthrobacter sp. PAMC 25486]AIY01345.1 Molybdenum ABC transporter, ATP-binding protein ModC [Arthrobacter sp. PAMC 25486]